MTFHSRVSQSAEIAIQYSANQVAHPFLAFLLHLKPDCANTFFISPYLLFDVYVQQARLEFNPDMTNASSNTAMALILGNLDRMLSKFDDMVGHECFF